MFMERKVDRTLIDRWVDEHGPDGLLRLAVKSGVSTSTIAKARLGQVPRRFRTRHALCKVLGVPESALFPEVVGGIKAG